MHILSPETDNCPSWISGKKRMTVENISWSISTKECCRPRRGLNPRPPGLQSDGASNWATDAGRSLGWYSFFAQAKHPYYQVIWVIWLFCAGKKSKSPYSEHSAVLPLTRLTISNGQICQKEKCMINRLWYGNFRADMGVSDWYRVWYENCHIYLIIWFLFLAWAMKSLYQVK